MKNDGWIKAKRIFAEAKKLTPDERVHFLDEVCADDADTRREVESLLSSFDDAESFMENPAVGEVAEIVVKEKLESEPAKISYHNQTPVTDEELLDAPDENALRPSRLRFALICLLFALLFIDSAGFAYRILSSDESLFEWNGGFEGKIYRVEFLRDENSSLRIGDEIISFNGQPLENNDDLIRAAKSRPVGDSYTVEIKRGGELSEVQLFTQPLSLGQRFLHYLFTIILPASFFLAALLVFLLKPNDKLTLLMALMFCLLLFHLSLIQPPDEGLPLFFIAMRALKTFLIFLFLPTFFHFFLIFPERPGFVRRFPRIERWLYLLMLFTLPLFLLIQLKTAGLISITDFPGYFLIRYAADIPYLFYPLGGLTLFLFNYFRANRAVRRKLNVIAVGLVAGLSPFFAFIAFLILSEITFMNRPRFMYGDLFWISVFAPFLLIPLAFAYAVVRHKVIPVSLIVRRGLQYLLAKNALRLLLILPILGIVWNIAANPNRTLSEILLNNSFAFYSFLALAAGFFLLMRLRFSDWIDRRFFREQYDQEKILRELTEAVKESDSLPKLSRMVSSKIQAALHPSDVYLFFQEERNSDFSLGYTTSDASENSANLKLTANSPLLRFMQQERGAIEFPTRQTDDLPNREKRWLREINSNLLVPMHGSDGKLAGIFSLGEKMSQIPYTQRDKELLGTLANQIALVHEILGLKDRVRREQRIKTEVLSRFDEADINLLKECPACGRCFDRNVLKCTDDDSNLTFTLPVERTIENRYRLEKLLGKGGMGAVYEATDTRINRRVAVKILSGAMFGNRDALRRFEREAQTAGKLNHRNIVTVFDYGILSTEGAFLVMELVAGETLSAVLKRKGKLDAKTVAEWFGQVLDGMDAAHKAGIVHRDLKPDNIFVTRNEDKTVRLCILDFGLARFNESEFTDSVTAPGTLMGTLGYMSPEQLNSEKTDWRSDLFAAGVIIYECLHGEKPFAGKTYQEIMRSMSKEIIFDEDETFTKFFERSLAQKPEKRFASASEMKGNLSNSSFILKTD